MFGIVLAASFYFTDAVLSEPRDFAFSTVQEEWVYDVAKPKQYNLVLAGEDAALLKVLDCEHHECRSLARDALRKMTPSRRARLVFWGSKSRSKHLREWCKGMTDSAYLCRHCVDGQCKTDYCCHQWSLYEPVCRFCDGITDLRLEIEFDVDRTPKVVPSRRLFEYKEILRSASYQTSW